MLCVFFIIIINLISKFTTKIFNLSFNSFPRHNILKHASECSLCQGQEKPYKHQKIPSRKFFAIETSWNAFLSTELFDTRTFWKQREGPLQKVSLLSKKILMKNHDTPFFAYFFGTRNIQKQKTQPHKFSLAHKEFSKPFWDTVFYGLP